MIGGTQVMPVEVTETAAGFEVVLAITILLAFYIIGWKRR